MDLTTVDPRDGEPWDFARDEVQDKAVKRIEEEDPGLVLVSPECSPFSALQMWNHPRMMEQSVCEELSRGMKHLAFATLICLLQYHRGDTSFSSTPMEHEVGGRR